MRASTPSTEHNLFPQNPFLFLYWSESLSLSLFIQNLFLFLYLIIIPFFFFIWSESLSLSLFDRKNCVQLCPNRKVSVDNKLLITVSQHIHYLSFKRVRTEHYHQHWQSLLSWWLVDLLITECWCNCRLWKADIFNDYRVLIRLPILRGLIYLLILGGWYICWRSRANIFADYRGLTYLVITWDWYSC